MSDDAVTTTSPGALRFDGFGAGAVRFYEELAANNTRDWFRANRRRYDDDVRAPLEYLLADLAGEFGEGKVFRPNRDTRFSRDKSPYKTAAAAVIERSGDAAHSLYLQLSADGLMVAGGAYMLAGDPLARLRAAVADDRTGPELERIVADLRGRGAQAGAHDELKTAPRGYPKDHPRIDLLRWKGVIAWFDHPPGAWLSTAAARDRVVEGWRALAPMNAWLDAHVRGAVPAD
ncbi:MAG TPA: DUF2461 domain-containing protein [Acidimicrobiales bacterium]